ncbi:shikimate dehydrogenase [Glycomyces buryatensis]|uniref:Shikimate dehydrogenase (NADP(+)) n=1 Tax=Glycomyces buryatensis TaxID=2570927 RepID=A0A4S8Q6K2_9ACTN|nr:shikimate dehydrogenase [Glycomyces buryatensis]THV36379.1 shikimate dehydrogenase [Glycomyces buryatensis]
MPLKSEPQPSHLIGLIGSGIGPSLSPALHEREADELGLRYQYRRLDLLELDVTPERISELLEAARLTGYTGLNLTHPVKQLVIAHLDMISEEAAVVGAVNTVLFKGGKAFGYNTDASGFARSAMTGLAGTPMDQVVVLGAGGAGAAVAHALLAVGAGTVRVLDLDPDRSARLADALGAHFGRDRISGGSAGELKEALRDADGLAHATPTGMREHPGSAVPAALLRPDLWVAEIVYRPLETELLTAARAAGCRVLDGGRMAVFQAVDSFRLFTGIEPDAERMLRHFDELAGRPAVKGTPSHADD